jgi:mono/diheme cytochrome c family protein
MAVKLYRRPSMMKTIRSMVALAAVVTLASSVGFAQSGGEATYKAKCMGCHGATGLADSSVGKALKVKPVTDPSVAKFSEADMIGAVKNGMGKMSAYKDKLTDAEIKDSVSYFRTFIK